MITKAGETHGLRMALFMFVCTLFPLYRLVHALFFIVVLAIKEISMQHPQKFNKLLFLLYSHYPQSISEAEQPDTPSKNGKSSTWDCVTHI